MINELTFSYFKNQQVLNGQQLIVAQIEQPQTQPESDPLIDYGAEHLIDFGIVLIVFAIVIIIGMISKQNGKGNSICFGTICILNYCFVEYLITQLN